MTFKKTIVVPCFNEEHRLDGDAFVRGPADLGFLFVDDGSTDKTSEVLVALVERLGERGAVHICERNGGKGEAVRQGLLRALADGAEIVGYLDADLAAPVHEAARLATHLEQHAALEVVLGIRLATLGRNIERKPARHYLGRVFATAASIALGVAVYDTQCGAKVFRDSKALRDALQTPFSSKWAFDVELLGRLLRSIPEDAFVEVPLDEWHHIEGSKLTARHMVTAGLDLLRIGRNLRRHRH